MKGRDDARLDLAETVVEYQDYGIEAHLSPLLLASGRPAWIRTKEPSAYKADALTC